MAVNMYKHW